MINPSQLAALKTELQTDPATLGFAALITKGQDAECARVMNTLGIWAIPAPALTEPEIRGLVDPDELFLLDAVSLARLDCCWR